MTNQKQYHCFVDVNWGSTEVSLQRQLQQFLWTHLVNFDKFEPFAFERCHKTIRVSRLSSVYPIIYRCAIAFSLASYYSLTPLTLAKEIFQFIAKSPIGQSVFKSPITLSVIEPGWLEFEISDRSLAIWLQTLTNFQEILPKSPKTFTNYTNLFPIEYTHARCCNLLYLANQERIIQLNNATFDQNLWSFKSPALIPWYNSQLNQLRLSNPHERSLISQIVMTSDRLDNQSDVDEIKLAHHLSQYFLTFERYCRIFGEIAQNNPKLSQSRLGLVSITRNLLKSLWSSRIHQLPRTRL